MEEQRDEVLVVHSLRQAQAIFKLGSPSTVQAWIKDGRLDGTFEHKTWTIRIPPDHPDLPRNKAIDPPLHYPRVEVVDERDARIARLEAENRLLREEVTFLREEQLSWQRALPDLALRLVEQLKPPPALPAPEPKPRRWWHWLY